MNAAFLLVTTAWFAGDTAAATPAPAASACCGTSRDACDCGGHKLLDKLRGAFKRNDCCDTCAAPKCHAPAPKCHAPAPKCHAPKCAPATCDSCGHNGPKLLDRLKAHFHHDKGCCDGGSSTCCGTTGTSSSGETIPTPPKKMPNPGNAPPAKVGIDTEPSGAFQAAPGFEAAPNAGQVPPAVVPNVESENLRSPF